MNRYLSTVSLYIRSNLWRVLAAALAAALLCGILVYCYPSGEYTDSAGVDPATGQEMLYTSQYPTLDGVVKASGAPIAGAAGFVVIVLFMSLTGCGYGVKSAYTVRRLRLGEKKACLLWALYHAALLVVYWAALAAALYTALTLRSHQAAGESGYGVIGPQTMLLLCYTDPFLHRLFPMQDIAVWAVDIASVLAVSLSTIHFSYRQRCGGFSVSVFFTAPCVIAAFFCPLGSGWNHVLLVLLLALAGGALCDMMGGGGDAAQAA